MNRAVDDSERGSVLLPFKKLGLNRVIRVRDNIRIKRIK